MLKSLAGNSALKSLKLIMYLITYSVWFETVFINQVTKIFTSCFVPASRSMEGLFVPTSLLRYCKLVMICGISNMAAQMCAKARTSYATLKYHVICIKIAFQLAGATNIKHSLVTVTQLAKILAIGS